MGCEHKERGMTRAATRDHAKAESAELLQALRDVLPLAEQYLIDSPLSKHAAAKMETARDLIRKHDAKAAYWRQRTGEK